MINRERPTPAAALIDLHDKFCAGFEQRRPDLVLDTVADLPGLVVVTSEEAVLRGTDELRAFLERYVVGSTTYSWRWERRHTVVSGTFGCLLAVGTELERSAAGERETPYRMTLVAERKSADWVILQIHGSSPHYSP